MSARRRPIAPALLFTVCFALTSLAGDAGAAAYTWVQPTCGRSGCSWSTPDYWSGGSGTPGSGDTAEIARAVTVSLTRSVGTLAGLTLENGARVYTRGYSLSVGANGANTFLFGTGTTGSNTRIVVEPGSFLGFDLYAFFLSLHQGAELRMQGGGAVVSFGLNISPSSLISGHGTVLALDSATRFDVAGAIRPSGGDLTIVAPASGILDLDGNIGGVEHGRIEVVADGDLFVEGALADPFSGVIEIANRNTVEFDTALEIDGALRFTSGIANHLVAPRIGFGMGAEVRVDQAIGWIDAASDWRQGASIEVVQATDELHLVGASSFGATTEFAGRGLLVNDASSTMTLADGVDLSMSLVNEGELVIGDDEFAEVSIGDFEQAPSGLLSLELGGTVPGVGFDRIVVTDDARFAGALDVIPVGGFQPASGQRFEIIDVVGSVSGEFEDLPEGGTYGVYGGEPMHISYRGGDGNDVVLYVPEPGTNLALASGFAGLLGLARRARRVA